MQISIKSTRVLEICSERPGVQELKVGMEESDPERALNYPALTGRAGVGDRVLVNVTAEELGLGTGGYHFVYHISSRGDERSLEGPGHIMKLRYTPFQFKTVSAGEKDGPLHDSLKEGGDLEGRPVVIFGLHSMLAPVCGAVAAATQYRSRVAYIMTDGGALPLPLSRTVHQLRDSGLLHHTVTCGHAFGGDYEAVTLCSGLLSAHTICPPKEGLLVAGIGPGVVGTGTRYGHTGLEQGIIANAVAALDGIPVCIPRVSFGEPRPRHRVLSHHTITALGQVALARTVIPIPDLPPEKEERLQAEISRSGLAGMHKIVRASGREGFELLLNEDITMKTMGRGPDQDQEFFLTASAGGRWAALTN